MERAISAVTMAGERLLYLVPTGSNGNDITLKGDNDVKVWGFTDGNENVVKEMTGGSLLLMTAPGTKRFNRVAEVDRVIYDRPDLGKRIWPSQQSYHMYGNIAVEKPFSIIAILRRVTDIDVNDASFGKQKVMDEFGCTKKDRLMNTRCLRRKPMENGEFDAALDRYISKCCTILGVPIHAENTSPTIPFEKFLQGIPPPAEVDELTENYRTPNSKRGEGSKTPRGCPLSAEDEAGPSGVRQAVKTEMGHQLNGADSVIDLCCSDSESGDATDSESFESVVPSSVTTRMKGKRKMGSRRSDPSTPPPHAPESPDNNDAAAVWNTPLPPPAAGTLLGADGAATSNLRFKPTFMLEEVFTYKPSSLKTWTSSDGNESGSRMWLVGWAGRPDAEDSWEKEEELLKDSTAAVLLAQSLSGLIEIQKANHKDATEKAVANAVQKVNVRRRRAEKAKSRSIAANIQQSRLATSAVKVARARENEKLSREAVLSLKEELRASQQRECDLKRKLKAAQNTIRRLPQFF